VRVFAAREKRTAFLCTVALIEANGYSCAMPDSEAIADGARDVAGHRFGENEPGVIGSTYLRAKGLIMARLPLITSKDQVAEKDRAIVDSIVASRGALQGPFTMFLHCPELAGRLAHLGAFVRFEGSLDMRVRVLAAMTVAREFEAVYVWGAQTDGARRLGVPEATITAIRENHSRGIPPEDAQIVEVTRQLLRRHRVDDAAASALRARFGEDGFIQLTGAIGYYSMLSMTVNACELEAAPGAEVLKV
jgi:4-carboxymuconolactone decarboxylase